MAICAMAIALLGVATSFAVAIFYGATALPEYSPVVSPNIFTQHMCACRSRTFERTVPQAEVQRSTLKAERNPSINAQRKRAIKSAKWGRQMVSCCFRVNSRPACTC